MTTPEDTTDPGTDEQEHDDTVATGILAAERRAQEEIARRRRFLVGGAVLGLLIAGAVLAVMTALQQRANTEAERAADLAEARATFAEDVVDRAEDYEPPSIAIGDSSADLRTILEQFLTETEVSDAELTRRAERELLELGALAADLEDLTRREVPQPPELVDPDRAVTVLRELETLRAEAGALTEEVPLAVNDVELWLGAVRDVNRAVAEHVALVEAEEATSDPDELVELWRAERPALLRLSAAATAADDVPGLEAWAGAHQQYAEDLLSWIEEAVTLLQAGEVETYNERFEDEFSTSDPFGLNAAVGDATDEALASPALLQLGTLQERASLVRDAVDSAEVTAGEQLADDA